MSSNPKVIVSALTHVGAVRAANQDCLSVDGWITQHSGASLTVTFDLERPLVLAVIDGMGGHPGGDMASLIAARGLATLKVAHSSDPADANARIQALADLVHETGQRYEGFSRMGATLVGTVLKPSGLLVFNVGDCSMLRVSDGYVGQLAMIDRRTTGEQAQAHSGAVTQCLGGTGIATAIDAHAVELAWQSGETYVLCSDGLSDVVSHSAIAAIVRQHLAPELIARQLVGAALAGGAPDNVSVIVVQRQIESSRSNLASQHER